MSSSLNRTNLPIIQEKTMETTTLNHENLYVYPPYFEDSIKYTEEVKQLSEKNWVTWVIDILYDCQHNDNIVVSEVQKWLIHYEHPFYPMILFQCEQKGQIVLEFELNWCDYPDIRIDGILYEGVNLWVINGVVKVSND